MPRFSGALHLKRKAAGWHRDFLDDQHFFLPGQLQAEPDAEPGEEQGNQPAVDLERVLHDQKAKLDQPEHDDQHAAAEAVDQMYG